MLRWSESVANDDTKRLISSFVINVEDDEVLFILVGCVDADIVCCWLRCCVVETRLWAFFGFVDVNLISEVEVHTPREASSLDGMFVKVEFFHEDGGGTVIGCEDVEV